ncbi:hypothetical protein WV31_13135 [Magnetospirillum sp. ME-1]|uniref:polysaccharide biosynthesis protein n=1 Tax=Magnetospirillum sp. ME-1 TaxID=1639348 RepID=UPI000A17D06E|nr:polysaccharide biosynthesis protein [Magnetospirillum sp. ME-1]ARJ66545.1 hypothetical protein WV31_13135 [Magnetospirillum sp. ME-1]
MITERLARLTGHAGSRFHSDMEDNAAELAEAIGGKRILVIGAAGSIGSAFVRQLVRFKPRGLHLVDINENNLVEVVRDLRSSLLPVPDDFVTTSIDFASLEFQRYAEAAGSFDAFLNFSALKHVRAERDVFSLMRMVDVNVRALHHYLRSPAGRRLGRAFSVSTDKSVCPANLMGATKNLMEQVLFASDSTVPATTARFANVAFSAGSLLEGFERRLEKRQPLSAPADVRRYFMTHEEAGQLCLLAGFLADDHEVFCPKVDAGLDVLRFDEIAVMLLESRGLKPLLCASEDEARRTVPTSTHWPCWFAPSDTTGEKPQEEFFRDGDVVDYRRFTSIAAAREAVADPAALDAFLTEFQRLRSLTTWSKADLAAAITAAVPDLLHVERHRNLDQKM